MEELKFDVADVRFVQGSLVIDTTGVSPYGKHYNVVITKDDNRITVTGDKSIHGMSLDKGAFDLNEITEDSIEEYRPYWIFSKKTKKRSTNLVEYKEREKRTYSSDKWTIIEEGDSNSA